MCYYYRVTCSHVFIINDNETLSSSSYKRVFYSGILYGTPVKQLINDAVYVKDDNEEDYYILNDDNNVDSLCQHLINPFIYLHPNYTSWTILSKDTACQPVSSTYKGITEITCDYSTVNDVRVAFVHNSSRWQRNGYVHQCSKRLQTMDSLHIKNVIKPAPRVLLFFEQWIFDDINNKYISLSINSLFDMYFYQAVNIELQYCVNGYGQLISGGGLNFIKDSNFRLSSGGNYHLLMVDISPFMYFGTIDIDDDNQPTVTCSFAIQEKT